MKKGTVVLLVIFILFSQRGFSKVPEDLQNIIVYLDDQRENDVQLRTGFEITKGLGKGWSISWEEEVRMRNYITSFDRINSAIAVGYKPLKYLKLDLGYTFMAIYEDGKKSSNYQKYWNLRHRIQLDIGGIYEINRWKFTLRERGVVTIRGKGEEIDLLEKTSPTWELRSRVMAEYSIRSKPLKTYLSVEIINTLYTPLPVNNYISDVRTTLGLTWRINARNSMDFYYRFAYGLNKDIDVNYRSGNRISSIEITNEHSFNHIIGIFYSYKF